MRESSTVNRASRSWGMTKVKKALFSSLGTISKCCNKTLRNQKPSFGGGGAKDMCKQPLLVTHTYLKNCFTAS